MLRASTAGHDAAKRSNVMVYFKRAIIILIIPPHSVINIGYVTIPPPSPRLPTIPLM